MIRTQIYLPKDLHRNLVKEADKRNTTISHLIRLRISAKPEAAKSNSRKVLLDLIKTGENLSWAKVPKNLSEKIDEVVYG